MKHGSGRAEGFDVDVYSDNLERWEWYVEELLEAGVPLPLEHRPSWIRDVAREKSWFVEVKSEEDGSLAAAFPMKRTTTRSLPGHYELRIARFGYAVEEAGLQAALEVLRRLVDERGRLLSLNVEMFVPDGERREALEEMARSTGYGRSDAQRRYRWTTRLDLSPDEDDLLMSFTGSCRRFIRDPEKKGYSVEPVEEDRWADRMDELWEETFSRTGAQSPPRVWRDHLRFARRQPDLYHIVGTFGPGRPAPESLKSFSCVQHNGDHAVYSDGASTRDVESGVALSYAPMWELIRWAKEHGCAWFDMGGISSGTYEDDEDPRGGISDFKRRFTEDVVEVGTEWEFRPDSLRTALSDRVSASASALRQLLGSLVP